MSIRTLRTSELSAGESAALRRLLDDAFARDFSDDDWDHARGGWHILIDERDRLIAHGSVVPRRLHVADRAVLTGYVEAVAVAPAQQRHGLGTAIMRRANEIIQEQFELGALSTGKWAFYARLGWERWSGPTWVRHADGRVERTPDEDAGIMVLRGEGTRHLDTNASITCDARAGDSW